MNSLMSMRTIAFSSSNKNSASALVSSVLPTPVGPRNKKRSDRPIGIAEPGAVAAHGIGDRPHRIVLTDHPLAEPLFHLHQLFALAFEHAGDGHAGPAAHDLGDLSAVTSSFTSDLPSLLQFAKPHLGLFESSCCRSRISPY